MDVQFTFYAPDGSSVEVVTVGEAMDAGDKSSNKAMSAALKYALLQVFCIPTEEPIDTENETHEVAAKPERQQKIDRILSLVKAARNGKSQDYIDSTLSAASEKHGRTFNRIDDLGDEMIDQWLGKLEASAK